MTQKKAIFNNGQTGALPPVSVIRDTAKYNPETGEIVAVNTPAYGHVSRRCRYNLWTEKNDGAGSWHWPTTGYDMDGVTKMASIFNPGSATLSIFRGTDIDDSLANGGSAIIDYGLNRISDNSITLNGDAAQDLIDIMHGASTDAGDTLSPNQSSEAYRARAGILLPGCFLYLCEKQVDQGSDVWDTEGISLVAFQSDGDGGFTRHWIGNHVGDTVPFASGRDRIREWAMVTYFPFTHMQNPCLRAFIPYVDYIFNSPLSIGGECGIIEATRADIDSSWVFGGLYHIFEKIETQVHFHTAAWTPRGVVLSQGDGETLNETRLFTCDDWDDYENDAQWTQLDKNYGSGNYAGQPENAKANQWAGSSPSRIDPNKFFCASDVTPHGLWACTVEADLTQHYKELWGYPFSNDINHHVALEFSGPCKEIQPGMCFSTQNQLAGASSALATKIIAGTEETGFACIARHPAGSSPSSFAKIYGDDVYLFNLGGAGPEIYKMTRPHIETIQGLSVGPGGTNKLQIVSGSPDTYDSVVALGGNGNATLTVITADVGAPGTTPVMEIESDGGRANSQLWRFSIGAGTQAYVGPATWIVLWARSMDPKLSVPLRMIMTNTGGSNIAYNVSGFYAGVATTDWTLMVMTMEEGVTPPSNPNDGSMRWETSATVIQPCHFQFQLQGVYTSGPQCPYLIAPQTTSDNEQVEQSLGDVGTVWTVGIELHVPATGEDFDYAEQLIKQTIILATIFANGNDYIEITVDIPNEEVDFNIVISGSPIGVVSTTLFNLCRDCTILLGVTYDGTTFTCFAACGGLTETGLPTVTKVGAFVQPMTVRVGSFDFAEVPNTELNMVAVDNSRALDAADFLDMMAEASAVDTGGAGYAAMSYANLVTPKII